MIFVSLIADWNVMVNVLVSPSLEENPKSIFLAKSV